MRNLKILFCLLIALTFSGCGFFAPSLNSINKAGLTESGRRETLAEAVKGFNTARFWENYQLANAYAAQTNFDSVKSALQQKRQAGRIVESKVDNVAFFEDAYKAEVEVNHKVQNFATNIVNPQAEKQSWTFSIYDGWKIDSLQDAQS